MEVLTHAIALIVGAYTGHMATKEALNEAERQGVWDRGFEEGRKLGRNEHA